MYSKDEYKRITERNGNWEMKKKDFCERGGMFTIEVERKMGFEVEEALMKSIKKVQR